MNTIGKWILTAAAFALVFVLGYLLNRSGKPYAALTFNLHKLIAVGVMVFLLVTVLRENKANGLGSLLLAASILSAFFFLATIITGGLLSVEKTMPDFVYILHRWLPYLTLLSTTAVVLLLLRGH